MRLVIAFAVALPLAACAAQPPSDQDARKAFSTKISAEAKAVPFNIDLFEKTNGQALEVNGIKGYRYYYTVSVSFPSGYRPECARDGFAGFDCGFAFGTGASAIRPIPKNTTVSYAGVIAFQNTEKGWIADQVELRESNRTAGPDDTMQRLGTDPNFVHGEHWGEDGGYRLVFQTPTASTKQAVADITAIWPRYLEEAGVHSYVIRWNAPDRISLCVQKQLDPQPVKQSLLNNTLGAVDLRAIEESTFDSANCT